MILTILLGLLVLGIPLLIFGINFILLEKFAGKTSLLGILGILFFAKGFGGLLWSLIFYILYVDILYYHSIYVSSFDPYLVISGIIIQGIVIFTNRK